VRAEEAAANIAAAAPAKLFGGKSNFTTNIANPPSAATPPKATVGVGARRSASPPSRGGVSPRARLPLGGGFRVSASPTKGEVTGYADSLATPSLLQSGLGVGTTVGFGGVGINMSDVVVVGEGFEERGGGGERGEGRVYGSRSRVTERKQDGDEEKRRGGASGVGYGGGNGSAGEEGEAVMRLLQWLAFNGWFEIRERLFEMGKTDYSEYEVDPPNHYPSTLIPKS